jgi:TPR repeat protein
MGDGLSCESLAGIEAELEAAKPKRDIDALTRRQIPFYRRACELGTANGCAFIAAFIVDKVIDGSAQEAFDLYVKACSRGNAIACRHTAGLLHRNEQEWKAIAAKLDVNRLTADLMSRACKLGDAKSCAPAKPSP